MLTTKYHIGKYACYVCLGILFMVLQNAPGFFLIFGIKPLLVFALAIAVAVLEKETAGSMFAIFAGLLCDLYSGYTFGFYIFTLFAACLVVGLLSKGYIRPTITNCFMFTLLFMIVIQWTGFFFSVFIWVDESVYHYFISHYVTLSLYTAITALPIFLVVVKIHHYFQKRIAMA